LQAYTGFIYRGPAFAKQVNAGLLDMMDKNGVKTIGEVIGTASGRTR
jgi:dihydroorotate dehydrogenase